MADDELCFRPAVELAARVRARELSPVELVELALTRIERLNPELNAVVTLDAEGAREAARAAERRVLEDEPETLPPFLGVPTLVKDVHPVAGMRTTYGARGLAEFVPPFDAEHVRRLRGAGLLLLGKTNVPELGTVPVTEPVLFGAARNPWDPSRTPGGSSGGAAAALAAGLVPVADGSDGGGSTRIPAAACGVLGLKPARGRVSNGPLFGDLYAGLVTPAPLARHVADAAAMLDVMAGYAPGDPTWAPPPARPFAEEAAREPGRLRVGLLTESPLPGRAVGAEAARATQDLGGLLESLGHDVAGCTLPIPEQIEQLFTDVWTAGLASNPVPPELLEPFNQRLAERGRALSAPGLLQSIAALQLLARGIVAACLAFDVVLFPTLAHDPFEVGELAGLDPDDAYDRHAAFVGLTPIANVTGQPAVSMPVAWSAEGLPIGVTAMGRPAGEATLLRLAAQVEAATGWPARRPPLS